MIDISITKLLEVTNGIPLNFTPQDQQIIDAITIDARKPCNPTSHQHLSLFVALESNSYSQDFLINQAIQSKYDVIITNQSETNVTESLLIKVDNCLVALQNIAKYVRNQVDPLVIAITGSCGKTSLKEILFSIFNGEFPQKVLATAGNLNNHIGVPLTLLNLTYDHKIAIVEHGASHIGEIEQLTQLSQPDIACINNVQPAHTEGFGSILGVAIAKSEIFNHLNRAGVRLVNLDSYFTDNMLSNVDNQALVTISAKQGIADFFIDETSIELSPKGLKFNLEISGAKLTEVASYLMPSSYGNDKFIDPQTLVINSNLVGKHNVYNLTMAIAIAIYAGLHPHSILNHIKSLQTYPGRNHLINITKSVSILDDCYNANPGSVDAMFETLKLYQDYQKVVVLGRLAELNDQDLAQFYTNVYERSVLKQEFKLLSLITFVDQIPSDLQDNDKVIKLNQHNKFVVLQQYSEPSLRELVISYLKTQLESQSNYFDNKTPKILAFKGSHSSNLHHTITIVNEFIQTYCKQHNIQYLN